MTAWRPFDAPIVVPDHWVVPPPWRMTGTGKCRSCRSPIAWAEHPQTGKKHPFDPIGASHVTSCPNREYWVAQKRAGAG